MKEATDCSAPGSYEGTLVGARDKVKGEKGSMSFKYVNCKVRCELQLKTTENIDSQSFFSGC